LFGRDESDEQWWAHEVERSVKYDWTSLLGGGVRVPELAPSSFDIGSVQRVQMASTTVYRVLRDTVVAARVKSLYQYRCQVCDLTIILPNGQPYAEAHHIQPLGSPHIGLDVLENVICLCPNHHVEFDYGVRKLRLEELRVVDGHRIGDEFVAYHNDRFFAESRLSRVHSSDP
jgi:hypothetical protein